MHKFTPDNACEDARGVIRDLSPSAVDAVTLVHSNAGAVRGNHYHKLTMQWAYIVSGRLLVATGTEKLVAEAGECVVNVVGEPHAWRALEDTDCVVFVRGPRAGHNYESDTYRLAKPILA